MSNRDDSARFLRHVSDHLAAIIASGTDDYGADRNAMWMASLDARTGRYPKDDARPAHIPKRVYRFIDAPRGCSLYWDQPSVVAAHNLSRISGDRRFADAADAYVAAFLDRCVAPTGMFLWGNHYYWDAFGDRVVWFAGEDRVIPCNMATETGRLHETRPIPPAWETFARVSPEATERCIREIAVRHVADPATGAFNRHADGRGEYPFIEAGGILAETLCWLVARTGDRTLADRALRVARFSWSHRGERTDLVVNQPARDRWDKYVATTEVGLWAGSLLRAADYLGGNDELVDTARIGTAAYLLHGWNESAGRYFGRVRVEDGAPDLSPETTPYMPGAHADLWRPQFPAHDYPFSLAETTLSLLERTGENVFAEGARRWAQVIREETVSRRGIGAYGEHYGRAILFLDRAAVFLGDPSLSAHARATADDAIATLFRPRSDGGMFAGHPGEDRYDAVDGVGYLLLALLRLGTGRAPDLMGMGL